MQAPFDALIRSGITRWGAFCLFSLSVALAGAAPPTPSALQDVRFWTTTDTTRIALETSKEVEYKHDTLENPNRIFVDLIDTRPEKQFRGLAYSVPVGDARVKQVRVALNQKGVTRVVIDVSGPMTYKVSRLTAPERVMVEVRAPGAPALKKKDAAPEVSKSTPAKRFVAPVVAASPAQAENPIFAFSGDVPRLSSSASSLPALPRGLAALGKADAASSRSSLAPRLSAAEPVESSESAPAPAQRDRLGKHSMTRVLGLKLNRIVIDPGHGGHDQGTSSKNGLLEKDLVLDIALRLGALVEEQLSAKVIYTRRDDTFIPLERRTQIANEERADLFLSIHANSSPYPGISGTETYYLSMTAPREDLETAVRENAGSRRTVGELNEILRKIALADKIDESRDFAHRVQSSAFDLAAKSTKNQVRNRGIKKAPFVVLIGAEMPSVLTEVGFLSNAREETLMRKPEYRQKMAEAIFKGIVDYSQSLSHFRVAKRASD